MIGLRPHSKLVRPSGLASINRAHPAARDLRWCVVAGPRQNFFIDMVTGVKSSQAYTYNAEWPPFGPGIAANANVSNSPTITGNPQKMLSGGTMATIVMFVTIYNQINSLVGIGNSSGNADFGMGWSNVPVRWDVSIWQNGFGVSLYPGQALTYTPYFYVCSSKPNFGTTAALRNLLTGQVWSTSITQAVGQNWAPGANHVYRLGCGSNGAWASWSVYAAVMFSGAGLTTQEVLKWTYDDPWGFWFAPKVSAPTPKQTATVLVGIYTLDHGLTALASDCDEIHLCAAGTITDYTSAAALSLASKDFGAGNAFASPSAGSPTGRKSVSTPVTDGIVNSDGTATQWAALDTANSRLMARGPLAAPVALKSGFSFILNSFAVHEFN